MRRLPGCCAGRLVPMVCVLMFVICGASEAEQPSAARGEPRYLEYEEGGHDVWTETYRRDDVFAWLFAQQRR